MATPIAVNVNTASFSELQKIPQVGGALATRILELRESREGPLSEEDFLNEPKFGGRVHEWLDNGLMVFTDNDQSDSGTDKVPTNNDMKVVVHMLGEMKASMDSNMLVFTRSHQQLANSMDKLCDLMMKHVGKENPAKTPDKSFVLPPLESHTVNKTDWGEISFGIEGEGARPKKGLMMGQGLDDQTKEIPLSKPLGGWDIDRLAPDSIYSGRKSRSIDPHSRMNVQTDLDRGQNPGSDPELLLGDRERIERAHTTSRESQRRGSRPDLAGPRTILPVYNGTDDWQAFNLQFGNLGRRFNWDKSETLDRLIECLRGKALKYYSSLTPQIRANLDLTVSRLDDRFNHRIHPFTARRQLSDLKQEVDEPIKEFGDRAYQLASDAYLGETESVLEKVATDAFLKGCGDRLAAYTACDRDPATLSEAVGFVRKAIANQSMFASKPAMASKF
jgi:hypothetical protein